MHSLLRRQIRRYLGDPDAISDSWQPFIEAVSAGYEQDDSDRRLIENTMEVMATELEERNKTLRNELTERRQAEIRLEQSLSLLRATLDATADGILAVDTEQRIESFNVNLMDMWRIPPHIVETLRTQDVTSFMAEQLMSPGAFIDRVRHLEAQPDAESFDTLELNDGRVLECYSRPRRIGLQTVGRVWSFRDITKRRQAESRLAYMANYDALTGLPNRNLLRERLDQAIKHVTRDGRSLALLFLDLDNFKAINDTLGHDVGDRVLQLVAQRLLVCLRACDTVGRLGGDEFTVIVDDMTSMDSIAALAQKIIDTLSLPFPLDGHELCCTVSVGITAYPNDSESLDGLMKNADSAMYRAKEQGRNTYRFFTEDMHKRAYERLLMENKLRGALSRREFVLHYQPQIDVKSGATVGIEALLRWNDSARGLVQPLEFIGVLEETGMIVDVGMWALEEACSFNKFLQKHDLPPIRVAVNISPRQFRQQDLIINIAQTLSRTGLSAEYLDLEITESTVADPLEAYNVLERLSAMGVHLSIDDFGTGYSSLSYLKRFPINALKIDRSFVHDILTDNDDAAITAAIIALSRSLRLKVIAEGVETAAQLNCLKLYGCNEVQGYLFARPMPGDQLIEWLRASQRQLLPDDLPTA
ncbi:MAG: EAL domain-containing protein [Propionivibrio sp.]|uniref:putative bifunctional diguanylate cyclase/phosphodiesterase n=1 Tax=Propionivibrio sp. TaxID=2212460 RepID=UPI0025DB2C22|nr:EAL domain-containing protein [Propionivibrio sp.]MBL0207609.1 EAL domain-containing protein [Propionivibrio sp.]